MTELVYSAKELLEDEDSNLNEFGYMLNNTWRLKRGMAAGISTDSIVSIRITA